MNQGDRITEVRIKGFKAISDISLKLDGLTVLIGDNGSGKSTILEALEIIGRAPQTNFVSEVISRLHGGLDSLLRSGESEFQISVTIEAANEPKIEYTLGVGKEGNYPVITSELLTEDDGTFPSRSLFPPESVIARNRQQIEAYPQNNFLLDCPPVETVLSRLGAGSGKAAARTLNCLRSIRVHLPFDTRASWLGSEQNSPSPLRTPIAVERAESLDRTGANLPNCYQALKNRSKPEFDEILDRLRLGLGSDLEDVQLHPASRGQIELHLKFRSITQTIAASNLSDGQLNFLAFVAISELGKGKGLLCFDEPESHLHPALLVRQVWELEKMGRLAPVLVCTHSDRFLDALGNPAASVVLCELDENRAVTLSRPDPKVLESWMETYKGVGQIRSEGYESHLFRSSDKT